MAKKVTDFEKIENSFKDSKAILNSIMEGPENIIAFSLDCDYNYIFFNQAHKMTMKDIWGVEIEIGRSMLEYISYPEDREAAKLNFDRALAGENFILIEEYGEEALSRNYWENIYSPIKTSNGIIGVTVFCIDVTERKTAENLLKDSEEKLSIIFQNANDMISLNLMNENGVPGKFIEVNNVASERLGYTREELLDMGPIDIVAPEKRDEMPKNAAILLENGHNTFEIIHQTKNGEKISVEVNNHLIKYKENEVCLAISRDISDRKKSEEALRESEEKYRTIFENVQDMFFQTDLDGKIIEISPSVKRYSKFSREELIGKSVDIIYNDPEDRKKLLKAIQNNGEVNDYELPLKDKNKRLVYTSVNAHFLYDSNKREIGVEGSLRILMSVKRPKNTLKLAKFTWPMQWNSLI